MELLKDLAPRFSMQTYNVMKNNCNNFTDAAAEVLLGTGIPKDIVDLPNEFLTTPLGKAIEPMLTQAQDNLMLSSNQLFPEQEGNVNLVANQQ